MACFIVPAAEAVITTTATKILQSKEKKEKNLHMDLNQSDLAEDSKSVQDIEMMKKIPFSRKLKWLNRLLWGGSALLAFEHLWHGEIVPYFPFLSAAASPADTAEMLQEMSTVGVSMAVIVTIVWLGIVCVSGIVEKRAGIDEEQIKSESGKQEV